MTERPNGAHYSTVTLRPDSTRGGDRTPTFSSLVAGQRQQEEKAMKNQSPAYLVDNWQSSEETLTPRSHRTSLAEAVQATSTNVCRPTRRNLWIPMSHSTEFPYGLQPRPPYYKYTKVLFFDGKSHQLIDNQYRSIPEGWQSPHLDNWDLLSTRDLGNRETPGQDRAYLLGSRFRVVDPSLKPTPPSRGRPTSSSAIGAGKEQRFSRNGRVTFSRAYSARPSVTVPSGIAAS